MTKLASLAKNETFWWLSNSVELGSWDSTKRPSWCERSIKRKGFLGPPPFVWGSTERMKLGLSIGLFILFVLSQCFAFPSANNDEVTTKQSGPNMLFCRLMTILKIHLATITALLSRPQQSVFLNICSVAHFGKSSNKLRRKASLHFKANFSKGYSFYA